MTVPAGRWCCMVVGNFEIFPKNLPVSSMMRWIRKWWKPCRKNFTAWFFMLYFKQKSGGKEAVLC